MQKIISINEFEKTVNSIDDIEEPILIKRENKEDLVVISLAEYKKSLFFYIFFFNKLKNKNMFPYPYFLTFIQFFNYTLTLFIS